MKITLKSNRDESTVWQILCLQKPMDLPILLVKTSNPSSVEISEAVNCNGEKISDWLADYLYLVGKAHVGESGYSAIGAVVGATFPEEAKRLRNIIKNTYFLVPGFGAQGGSVRAQAVEMQQRVYKELKKSVGIWFINHILVYFIKTP